MKATARWPRVARENAITALRCAVASWFALWWLNAGIGGRSNVPDNLPVGFLAVSIIVLSRDANSLGAWLLLGAVMATAAGALMRVADHELEPAAAPAPTPKASPKVSWLQHLEFPVRVALHMAFASLWVAVPSCVHLAGAASLADSADFESKGCVRSILDV